jgi:hypothetical protein
MNRLIMKLLACVAVTQMGTVGAAMAAQSTSTPDDEAWQHAVSLDTLEAYAKFSMDFPDSRHVGEARMKLAGTMMLPGEAQAPSRLHGSGISDSMEFVPNSMMVV